MNSSSKISKKVILLGHFGVGKTSLVQRFVHQKFSEEYLTTIGVRVDKKVIEISNNELTMIIWDIEGGAVQSKLPQSYFLGAHGIVYVFDLTRPSTYLNIDPEIQFFKNLLPDAAVQIVANKVDLLDELEIKNFRENFAGICNYLSSAKTGLNVENMFRELGIEMIK
ncbi:MAG: Rab family GTPase [Bacteroidota bacterium]